MANELLEPMRDELSQIVSVLRQQGTQNIAHFTPGLQSSTHHSGTRPPSIQTLPAYPTPFHKSNVESVAIRKKDGGKLSEPISEAQSSAFISNGRRNGPSSAQERGDLVLISTAPKDGEERYQGAAHQKEDARSNEDETVKSTLRHSTRQPKKGPSDSLSMAIIASGDPSAVLTWIAAEEVDGTDPTSSRKATSRSKRSLGRNSDQQNLWEYQQLQGKSNGERGADNVRSGEENRQNNSDLRSRHHKRTDRSDSHPFINSIEAEQVHSSNGGSQAYDQSASRPRSQSGPAAATGHSVKVGVRGSYKQMVPASAAAFTASPPASNAVPVPQRQPTVKEQHRKPPTAM